MAVLTTWQVFTVGAIGGLAAIGGLILAIVLALVLYALVARAYDAAADHRQKRRTLRAGRRQLATITTPDDLKDRP
ncbi:hypothetical protein RI578_06690 [Streptomyces sp. BB1-1-1]|uniref:hypothetical protein n=1 Tax=Streptomyces sp. BB1-1-1 TaxID=3074430 RepID=UPI002877C97B|nr:hypothetical protein [Streptomyces sp. BB1-1-1]WND34000.1 hypothetical protein RI578_06690 [Streptomyces sp. BB1-1-1]